MNFTGIVKTSVVFLAFGSAVAAQQRPLLTEDPRTVAEGTVVAETGVGYEHDAKFPLSGLKGEHFSILDSRLNFGLGDRAEFQLGFVGQHYLRLEGGAGTRNDWGDAVVSTKIRILNEGSARPMVSFRPTVVLPNSNDSKGIGTDTTNFFATLLFGKTLGSSFVFGNLGLGILDDATRVSEQNDVLVYGIASAVPAGNRFEFVAEWSGLHNAVKNPTPGGESRGQVRAGLRIRAAGMHWDIAATAGTTNVDHKAGFTAGLAREFRLRR